jgi:RNA polymerase sigma-70 factor (ECF subfamily)
MNEPSSSQTPNPNPDRLAEFHSYRGLLFSIAYRMLGSVADAEDILQEAYIRWQRASGSEIQSSRAFLVTVVSRLCINQLQSARVQREEYVGHWLPEPVVTDPSADPSAAFHVDDSLSMAFLVLLERLSPVERAVFLLREVFDSDYAEIAKMVGKDEANCRQIFHRARQHVAQIRPRFEASQQQREELLGKFLEASFTGNLDSLVALLSTDAELHADGGGKAPAVPNLVIGADRVARAILGGLRKLVPQNLTRRMARINGEPGVVSYLEGRPYAVLTLDVEQGRIKSIYIVTNPQKLAHLVSLPAAPC